MILMSSVISAVTNPKHLFSRSEILANPCPVPEKPGLYGWFFRSVPPLVPTTGCVTKNDLTLLYVGISPKRIESRENLRKRIRYHYQGNAEGSTLRLSLGVLLSGESGCPLRRVGSGKRTTFTHVGEQWLDRWLETNAYVCWIEHARPWEAEHEVLKEVSLPLNIQANAHHPFTPILSQMRREARRQANEEPIAREDNQQRRT
jgi:hypothetical protein